MNPRRSLPTILQPLVATPTQRIARTRAIATQGVAIGPLTRIEGHLYIKLEEGSGKIKKVWSESIQFHGLEKIVENRDPRDVWAFVQCIYGVCTSVHAIASVTAVENTIGSKISDNARLICGLVMGSQEAQDHVVHFHYLYTLDFVNVSDAAKTDPEKTLELAHSAESEWRGNNLKRSTKARQTTQQVLKSEQLSVFTRGYWDHPDHRLPFEADLVCVAHYLDALESQRSMIRICTVFGGKNSHPNFLVGGMACSIGPDSSESVNQVQMDQVRTWVEETIEFVNGCYYPDVLTAAEAYKDYFDIGATHSNYLAAGLAGSMFGGDPSKARISGYGREHGHDEVEPEIIMDGNLGQTLPFNPKKIEEFVTSAWYEHSVGDNKGLTPDKGETIIKYTGPKPPFKWLGDDDKYIWSKAPRYDSKPMQVGPITHIMLSYTQGYEPTVKLVNTATGKLGITVAQLNSIMGRTLACAAEAILSASHLMGNYLALQENIKNSNIDVSDPSRWEPKSWSEEYSGFPLVGVARGNLSRWVVIKNGKVRNYRAVVPMTWLAGGRDANGVPGSYEEPLMTTEEHPLANSKEPFEALRTVHSCDPCMSCGVHVLNVDSNEVTKVVTS